jgi:hypothetical protein
MIQLACQQTAANSRWRCLARGWRQEKRNMPQDNILVIDDDPDTTILTGLADTLITAHRGARAAQE